jgi:hypothetical protein
MNVAHFLSELYENLPEVGDLEKPKLVFFFDEAYLLFNDAPPALRQKVEQVVPYPDGTPGFYLARLQYAPDADQIFAAEQEARRQLVESEVTLDSKPMRMRYSQTDMGLPEQIFDGDKFTLIRGLEANPFILELRKACKKKESLDAWMEEWVFACSDQPAYMKKLGGARRKDLQKKSHPESWSEELESIRPRIRQRRRRSRRPLSKRRLWWSSFRHQYRDSS